MPKTVLLSSVARAAFAVALLALSACAPSPAPSPTTAPAKPAPTAAPAKAAAENPPPKPTESVAPKPTVQPTVQPAFDEKTVGDFYRGKTVRILVGYSAGGGFDVYSRLIARHLTKYIPGNPTVIVENAPGAAGLLVANRVFNSSAKDGTEIGNTSNSALVSQQLFQASGVQYDVGKLRYLSVVAGDSYVMVVNKSTGVARFDDLLKSSSKQLVIGATAPGSTVHDAAVLVRDVLAANTKVLDGYGGTADIRLAMKRGEVEGFFDGWTALKVARDENVERGEWPVLVQFSEQPLRDLPNVPLILSWAKNEEQRQLLRYGAIVPPQFSKAYFLSPDVPADRAAALDAAFMKTYQDKEFLAEAQKGALDIAPIPGDQVRKLVLEMMAMPSDIRAKLQAIMLPKAG